jgi:hypothetical protein
LVKDYNPEVERFIARAMRADINRRWQSAEQMADRLDAILVKLGQPSGPAVLKRWLENLGAKDGVKPPAEMAPAAEPATTGTIELGSHDLELEEIGAPPERDDGEAATEANPRRPARLPTAITVFNDAPNVHEAPTKRVAEATRRGSAGAAAKGKTPAPSLVGRFYRFVRRLVVRTLLLVALLATGAYLRARICRARWSIRSKPGCAGCPGPRGCPVADPHWLRVPALELFEKIFDFGFHTLDPVVDLRRGQRLGPHREAVPHLVRLEKPRRQLVALDNDVGLIPA